MFWVKRTKKLEGPLMGWKTKESKMNGVPGKRVQDVPHGQVESVLARLFSFLGGEGEAFISALNDVNSFSAINIFLKSGDWYKESEMEIRFRKIMGTNFIGVKEAMKLWGIRVLNHSSFDFSKLSSVILRKGNGETVDNFVTEKVCLEVSGGNEYVLVYYPGLSEKILSEISGVTMSPTKANCVPGWYLIRKSVYPNSLNKSWKEQKILIDRKRDDIPESSVLYYAHVLGYRLDSTFFKDYVNCFGRCSNVVVGSKKHSYSGLYHPGYEGVPEKVNVMKLADEDIASPIIGLATIRIG